METNNGLILQVAGVFRDNDDVQTRLATIAKLDDMLYRQNVMLYRQKGQDHLAHSCNIVLIGVVGAILGVIFGLGNYCRA